MEWGQLPNNNITCPHFNEWVLNFYTGGYIPVNPCKSSKTLQYILLFSPLSTTLLQQLWRLSLLRKEIQCGILPGFTHQYNNHIAHRGMELMCPIVARHCPPANTSRAEFCNPFLYTALTIFAINTKVVIKMSFKPF